MNQPVDPEAEHDDAAEHHDPVDRVRADISGVCSVFGTFEITAIADEAGEHEDRQVLDEDR